MELRTFRATNGGRLARLQGKGHVGRVVETVGRRVIVRDVDGARPCFLSGQRAVVGDEVTWEEARGEGGKLVDVHPRRTVLRRTDPRGEEQVLAANLRGLAVVVAAADPPFHGALVDRYLVAASRDGLDAVIVLNKVDLGIPVGVDTELALRGDVPVLRVSTRTGDGVQAIRTYLAEHPGPWAFVGYSGVGKTSLVQAMLPGVDVGPIGEISEYWGTGRHTTTSSRLFDVPGGGEIADSPGIRGFLPAGLEARDVRDHFPGVSGLGCKYRDCLHRPGEEGCTAEASVDALLLQSYRALLGEVEDALAKRRP